MSRLKKEVLEEVPDQIESYMDLMKIIPGSTGECEGKKDGLVTVPVDMYGDNRNVGNYGIDVGHVQSIVRTFSNADRSNMRVGPRNLRQNSGADLCCICLFKEKDTLVVPCGHLAMCSDCAKDCLNNPTGCPICRGQITNMQKVYK